MTSAATESTSLPGLVPGRWVADATHSEVAFTVRHLMSKVRGQFDTFEATVDIPESLDTASVAATIDLASVNTNNTDRDTHLRSSDFFSIEETPTMTFSTTGVRLGDDGIVMRGDLTIRDITKAVDLDVDFLGVGPDPWGGTRVGFEASTEISRKDWGISFNVPMEGDKVMIGDRIGIGITIEAVHQS